MSGSPLLTIAGKEVERIKSAKILGVTISSDLTWKQHMDCVHSKASQILYFLSMLKRAGACRKDLLSFYKTTVRCAIEYVCLVWHTSLTMQQTDQLESRQRRALRIMERNSPYRDALIACRTDTLQTQRERISQDFFLKLLSPEHRLHHVLPPPRENCHWVRRAKHYHTEGPRTL